MRSQNFTSDAAERSINVAVRFLQSVEETLKRLAEMPGIGAPKRFSNPSLSDVRMFPIQGFPNYLVFYRIEEAARHIRVLRVLHGARNIEMIFESHNS